MLVFREPNELERNDVRSLMEELIERMLSVRARLAEYDRSGFIVQWFAGAIDRFSVRFHIELLEVRGKSGQPLGVRQDSRGWHAENVPLVEADHGVQEDGVFPDGWLHRGLVDRVSPFKKFSEGFGAVGEREHDAADGARHRISSADVVIDEETRDITRILGEGARCARDGHEMFRAVEAGGFEPVPDEGFIGEGFLGSAAL